MVSKPNPYGDEALRYKLYSSYIGQMPLWNHPGDFNTGPTLRESMGMDTIGGCLNCLNQGSADYYNAYNAPSQFFYVPTKFSDAERTPYIGSGKYRKRKPSLRNKVERILSPREILDRLDRLNRPLTQAEIITYENALARWNSEQDEEQLKHIELTNNLKAEADNDWYSLVKELIPLGYEIADIVKIFYNTFSGKYGSSLMNDMLNIQTAGFRNDAAKIGYETYM